VSGASGTSTPPPGRPGSPWRSVLLTALAALPVLLLLLGLGTWQVQRLAWKTDLLARLAAAEAAAPVPLDPTAGALPEPYTKLSTRGRFLHDREALLGAEVRDGRLGAHLLTPLEREGGRRPALLVDRGWVPFDPGGAALDAAAPIMRPQGEVTVTGYARPAQSRTWLSATDDPARRRFFTFDPEAIGAALGLPAVEPFALVALAGGEAGARGELPIPATALPRPENPHLGYAITWYGLALSLVLVFLAWARRRLKDSRPA